MLVRALGVGSRRGALLERLAAASGFGSGVATLRRFGVRDGRAALRSVIGRSFDVYTGAGRPKSEGVSGLP